MSERMQQGTGKERVVPKSNRRWTWSRTLRQAPAAPSWSAPSRPGILKAPSQQGSNLTPQSAGKPAAGGSKQNDAASSSQVYLTDAKMNERARKLAAAGTHQDMSFQERARKLVGENSHINDEDDSKWPHNYRISRANVPQLEKVCSNLRQQLKRKPEDEIDHLDVNTLIWRMFMIVTQQAAVHLGNDFLENLHSTTNLPQRPVKQLFDVTSKLVREQTEIQGTSLVDWQEDSWKRTTPLTDRTVRLSTAKAYVFSDSGRISENLVSAWKEKIDWFMNSPNVENWIESTRSRWSSSGKCSQDSSLHCTLWPRSRTWWLKYIVNLSNSQDGSSSCQCTTRLYGEKKETKICVLRIPNSYQNMQENSRTDIGRFSGLDQRRSGTELTRTNRMENWIVSLRTLCSTSVKVDTQYSVDPVLWNEEIWKKQRKRKIVYTFLWWRGHSRIGSSHNHFRQSAQYLRSSRRSMQRTRSRFKKSNWPTELSTTNKTPRINDTVQGNVLHDYEQKFAILPDHLRLIKLCSNVGITKTVTKTVFWRPSTMRNWTIGRLMSRVSSSSRQPSWEHEDRSSFGGGCHSPSGPLRNGDHFWRWNLFLGDDREWKKQTRDGSDGGNPREPHRWHWRQGNSLPRQDRNTHQCRLLFSNGYVTISPAWVDRRRTWSVIASTRSSSTSRRRRSSRIQNLGTDFSFRIYVFSALVIRTWLNYLQKRRRSSKEISV